jgi:spermidine/putrescine transport system permease protein
LISFNENIQPGIPSLGDLSLKWYFKMLSQKRLITSLNQSIKVASITCIISSVVAFFSALAYLEYRNFRSKWFLFIIFSMFVPGVIQGLSLSVIFKIVEIKPSAMTIVGGHLLWTLPFAFTIILTNLSNINKNIILASRDLGANYLITLRKIVIPLIFPGIISSFIFSFLLSFNEYNRAVYLVGRYNTFPIYMFGSMNAGTSPTVYAMGGSTLILSFVAIFFIIYLTKKKNK